MDKAYPFDESDEDGIANMLLAMPGTCSLDIGDEGPMSQIQVARVLNRDQSYVCHIESRAIASAKRKVDVAG